MITEQPQPQGFLYRLKESVTVKLAFIGLLIILLLIPSQLVQNLIQEPAQRQDETEIRHHPTGRPGFIGRKRGAIPCGGNANVFLEKDQLAIIIN